MIAKAVPHFTLPSVLAPLGTDKRWNARTHVLRSAWMRGRRPVRVYRVTSRFHNEFHELAKWLEHAVSQRLQPLCPTPH